MVFWILFWTKSHGEQLSQVERSVSIISDNSVHHHAGDLALRSPKTAVNWDFEQSALLSKSFKLDNKDSNSEVLWLGDLYTTATYPFLFCIVT